MTRKDAPERQWYCFLDRRFIQSFPDAFGMGPECGPDRQCTGGRRGGLPCGWYELALPGSSAVVGDLAASDPQHTFVQYEGPCFFCDADEEKRPPYTVTHKPSCVWLRAVRLGGTPE